MEDLLNNVGITCATFVGLIVLHFSVCIFLFSFIHLTTHRVLPEYRETRIENQQIHISRWAEYSIAVSAQRESNVQNCGGGVIN